MIQFLEGKLEEICAPADVYSRDAEKQNAADAPPARAIRCLRSNMRTKYENSFS